jgi:hypothetical protein
VDLPSDLSKVAVKLPSKSRVLLQDAILDHHCEPVKIVLRVFNLAELRSAAGILVSMDYICLRL